MKFGAHVSAAAGLWNAPINAGKLECEVLQMFSRPPQGGKPSPITDETVEKFSAEMKANKIERAYIHAPYIINFASDAKRVRESSIGMVREELERGSLLGVRGVMYHPGSAKDAGQAQGMKYVIEGIDRMLDGYGGSCQLLIEISAGAGMVMGDTFEEIAEMLDGAERGKEVGVCFDTQHAFASGYDMRTKETLNDTFKQFDKIIGLDRLVLSHCNDSKIELGGHKDRHEHLGEGSMGANTFKFLVQHPKLQHIDLVLETPFDEKRPADLALLKAARGE